MSIAVAVALDAWLMEPPPRAHPVVGVGAYLRTAARRVPSAPPARAVAAGSVAWLGGAVTAAALGHGLERLAAGLGRPWGALLRGLVLWPLLSLRMLVEEVAAVEAALAEGTAQGAQALSRIVSRDTRHLGAEDVRGAAVESLAENLSDSLVAPLFWYVVAGLPGAAVYRFANTADASWGYLTPRWRHAGRGAARADDALNLVPARVTAALLLGPVAPPAWWMRLRSEARTTSSPNAGWPMAAMALRHDLRLRKPDHYDLHPEGSPPGPGSVPAALRTARRAAALAVALAVTAETLTRRPRGARP